mgnify:CR=1 FL=1
MKIVLLGAGGQLGQALTRTCADSELLIFKHEALDICQPEKLQKTLRELNPGLVINAAALTAVDDCERQEERAFRVNAFAVRDLARICRETGSTLVHFSTDYVFDGQKTSPYTEEDLPHPLNVYGASKLAGETYLREGLERHFLIRTSGLYGRGGNNFPETMLRMAEKGDPIRVVEDQVLAPTYCEDLARAVVKLLPTREYGLYHISNGGSCSWYRFAGEIFRLAGLDPVLEPISSEELGRPARRPAYSVLDNGKLTAVIGEELPAWDQALARYVSRSG